MNNKSPDNIDGAENEHVDVDKTKRKFSKAGVVAPIILTLANRPAWGNAQTKCAISGFDSLAIEGNKVSGITFDTNESCGALLSDTAWTSDSGRVSWPINYIPAHVTNSSAGKYEVYTPSGTATYNNQNQFDTAFPIPPSMIYVYQIFNSHPDPSETIYDALISASSAQFLKDMLSLYLSRENGAYTVLSTADITSIYDAFKDGGGNYEVKAGYTWTSTDFDNYLDYLRTH